MNRYITWVIQHRIAVIALTLLVTAVALFQARSIKIIIDPATMMPQSHPYVSATTRVEQLFGSKHVVIVGIRPKQGDIYRPEVLEKVERLTSGFLQLHGVVKENVLSLSAKRAKNIASSGEDLEVKPMLPPGPKSADQIAALRRTIVNNPVYLDSIVSRDGKMTAIIVEFEDEPGGFRNMVTKVEQVVDRERDPTVDIYIGGLPVFLAQAEIYSDRMGILLPIAIVILSLVLFQAFRTKQALILPLVTASLATVCGIGVMGASGIPMDVFNATTPILIFAVATGHAVQLLKRYYEEYHRLRAETALSPRQANIEAVTLSLQRVGPVMIAAGAVASLGFFSLVVFDISTVRTFGIFTGLGIFAALILEMTFIPALRSVLAPPKDQAPADGVKKTVWNKFTDAIADLVTGPYRGRLYLGVFLFAVAAVAGLSKVVEDNSAKRYFAPDLPFQNDDKILNQGLGGTNTIYLLIEGKEKDALKNPQTLQAIDDLQRHLEHDPNVGKTMSIADFIKRMNQAMHGDNPTYFSVPSSAKLISQYLLLYSMSGNPGDFDSYIDYDYRNAKLTVLLKTDSSAYVKQIVQKIAAFSTAHFPGDVSVRIGGSAPEEYALNETMVKGKILNIVQISAVVLVISSLIFRSLIAGILVLLPLLIAVVANFALMGWSGILLNIPTSLTSAMAVGIGADYAIYLIYRLREELAREPDEAVAIRKVLGTAGGAILFVAVAVAAGYGVLVLSFGFYIHLWLAVLIAAAMLVSALSALLLVPSLILTFRPRFIFKEADLKSRVVPVATALLVVAIGTASMLPTARAAELDLNEIVEKNAAVSKVMDSTSDATFTLTNKAGQERVRKVFGTTKLQGNGTDNMRMTRFLAPQDVKGTVTLLIEHADKDDDIWIYLPELKKVRRLVSSNKKDSFVGTDFSYADVIGYRTQEWNYRLLKEESVDNTACFVIEATPKTETVKANSGYSRRVTWIRKDNYASVKADYWDENGQMLKTATFGDIQLVDPKLGKWQPMRLDTNNIQTGHRTVIRFDNFKVNQQVKNDFFTTKYMEKE